MHVGWELINQCHTQWRTQELGAGYAHVSASRFVV
jgi:hypothetical protein